MPYGNRTRRAPSPQHVQQPCSRIHFSLSDQIACRKKASPKVRRRSWELCTQHTFVVYRDDFQYENGSLSKLLQQVYRTSKRASGQRATLWSLKCEYDYRIVFHEATKQWFAHLPRRLEPVPPLPLPADVPRIAAIDPNGSNFMAIYTLHGAWLIGQVLTPLHSTTGYSLHYDRAVDDAAGDRVPRVGSMSSHGVSPNCSQFGTRPRPALLLWRSACSRQQTRKRTPSSHGRSCALQKRRRRWQRSRRSATISSRTFTNVSFGSCAASRSYFCLRFP